MSDMTGAGGKTRLDLQELSEAVKALADQVRAIDDRQHRVLTWQATKNLVFVMTGDMSHETPYSMVAERDVYVREQWTEDQLVDVILAALEGCWRHRAAMSPDVADDDDDDDEEGE